MKNKLIALIGVAVIAFAVVFKLQAADSVGVNPSRAVPTINSTLSTQTYVTNGLYPMSIAASTSITNVVAINAGNSKDIALQFTAQAMQTNGGAVTLQLGRNVQGGSATNAIGTGLNIEWGPTVTLTLPANTATSATTVVSNWWSGSSAQTLGGAVGSVYVGWITTPANVTLTNYYIYFNQE